MDNQINEIRKANDIVDVISSYLPLAKKGKNYFGLDNNVKLRYNTTKGGRNL